MKSEILWTKKSVAEEISDHYRYSKKRTSKRQTGEVRGTTKEIEDRKRVGTWVKIFLKRVSDEINE